MNRRSAIDILFENPDAGQFSSDEPVDSVEEASDYQDEIEVQYCLEDELEQAMILERELLSLDDTIHTQTTTQSQTTTRSQITTQSLTTTQSQITTQSLTTTQSQIPTQSLTTTQSQIPTQSLTKRGRGRPKKNTNVSNTVQPTEIICKNLFFVFNF